MKRIISLVGIWTLLALCPGMGQAAPVGKITRLDGRVDITSPGQVARPAAVGDEVNVGDILRAKSESKAEVTFVDGNILRLSRNTRVQITQYMVETDRRRGLFNLFRGRIQSIVKSTLARAFGQEWRNRFEIHTPTAVVGVRGTNFLTYYEKGVSGAVFYEGTGYGFSRKREDAIKTIEAGQAMLVVSEDQPPMIRPATDAEMRQQIMEDKPPSQTEEEDGEQTVQAPTEEEGEQTTQTTTDQTGTADDTQETATTDGTGTTSDPTVTGTTTASTGTVDSDATNTTNEGFYEGEPLTDPTLFSEPENTATNYPTVGSITDPLTGVVPDEQPDLLKPFLQFDVAVTGSANLSFLESVTLTGSIDSVTGEGTLAVQGKLTQAPPATQSGTIQGKTGDGSAFTGYLGGATGSWNGLLSTIYVKEGQAGYLRGHLSADQVPQVGETILAGGPITRLEKGGSLLTPDQLETGLISLNQPLPILSSVNVGAPTNLGTATGAYFKGLETPDGRILGAWGLTTEGGTYGNTDSLETWSGTIGTYQPDTSYLLGQVDGTDLNANQVLQTGELGHVDMTGFATYLDSQHLGTIDLRYHGCYDPGGNYHSVGAGTYTLDPLAYAGPWGSPGGALYSNNLGNLASSGSIGGLFGERWSPWNENAAELFAMGDYTDSASGNPHLWVAPIVAWDPKDPNSGFAGFAGGISKTAPGAGYGEIRGGAAAIYMDSAGNTGWLTTGDLTSTGGSSAGGISGILYPDHGMWSAKGMWTRQVKGSVPNPSDFGVVGGTLQGFLSGDFAGTGSISGDLYDGKTKFFSSSSGSLPFGTYHLTLGVSNTYEAKPADSDSPSWSAKVGGSGGFGSGTEGTGYWLAELQGNWANTGEISAGITGTYITESHMGALQGGFDGLYEEGGTPGQGSWIGQSLGVFEGESLSFSGSWGAAGGGSLYANDAGSLVWAGDHSGLMGSRTSPWTGSAGFLAMGNYYEMDGPSLPSIWDSRILAEPLSGGKATGFASGTWKNGVLNGLAQAIYVAPDGTGGFLTGNVSGNAYRMRYDSAGGEYEGMWMGGGAWTPFPMVSGLDPATILVNESSFSPDGGGKFLDAAEVKTGDIFLLQGNGASLSFSNQSWGLWRTMLSGNYAGTPSDHWTLYLSMQDVDTNLWAGVMGSRWTGGDVTGRIAGAWIHLDEAKTGVAGGDLIGLLEPQQNNLWQALGASTWIETTRFLEMAGMTGNNQDLNTLSALRIPYVEIGRTNLSGSNGTLLVHMNDVIFFAYSEGARPLLWACPDAGGTYGAYPTIGDVVLLGGQGFDSSVSFGITRWAETGTGTGKWAAAVSGPGTVSGYQIRINGGAAGTFGSGIFGGTGAGENFGDYTEGPPQFESDFFADLYNYAGAVGSMQGTMVGKNSLWTGTDIPVTLQGGYSRSGSGIWLADSVFSYNSVYGTETTTDGGAFAAFLGGIENNDILEGKLVALYRDPSGNVGSLKGDLLGNGDAAAGVFQMNGAINREEMAQGGNFAAGELRSHIRDGYGTAGLAGSLGTGFVVSDPAKGGILHTASLYQEFVPEKWGIFKADVMGSFENPENDSSWSAKMGGEATFGSFVVHDTAGNPSYLSDDSGYWLGQTSSIWSGGKLAAQFSGQFLTKRKTGTMTGELLGTYSGTGSGSWEAVHLGSWQGQDLSFSSEYWGDSFQLVKGTLYESEFERRIATSPPEEFDAHYRYDYFVADDGRILFGEKNFHEFDQPEEPEEIYLPDGTRLIISEGPLPMITTQQWTVGSLSETAFTTFPETGDWERRWYEEWETNSLAKSGLLSGILGGTADLWSSSQSAPAAITLMGKHEFTGGTAGKPSLFGVEIASSEITTGAYRGYLGGIMEEGIAGGIHALYVDPSQNAGILRGNFSGSSQHETGIWEASGYLYPLAMETGTGIPPDALLLEENVDRGIVGAWLGGDFGSQGTEIQMDMGWGSTLSLKNHSDWGVYRIHSGFDGFYSNPTASSSWTATMGGWAEFGAYEDQAAGSVPDMGIWLTAPMNGTLQNGLLSASYAGKFLSSTKYGELFGDLIGGQDESLNGWQAVASGYWKKIQDLKFNGSLGGEGLTMVEENHGHWDNGMGSYYDYGYQTGINAGWSFEYDAASNISTHVAYHPDGTTSTWIDASGAMSFIEGTYSGSIYDNVRVGPGGITVEPEPDPSYHLGYNGHVEGLLGGLEDLWNPDAWSDQNKGASLRFIGEFDEGPYFGYIPTSVFSQVIKTHNPYDQTPTIWDQGTNSRNGGYFAYAAGRSLADHTLEANILGIYVDAEGNGGFVKGFLNGVSYPKPEMWEGEGGLFPIALPGVTGYDAALLHSSGILTETFMDSWVTPVLTDDIHLKYVRSQSVRLSDEHWGVRSSLYGGTYNAFAGDNWGFGFSADEMDLTRRGYLFSSTDIPETAGSWSNGLISGKGVASWVNWSDAVTGVSAGDLKGTFNPTNFTWQAAALWASLDTAKFMDMVRSGQTDVLNKLNIPCVEIGRANLVGSQSFTGGNMNVNMQNVTFFSYSTGARPRIWATDQVTGGYSGGPIPGLAVPLSGANYNNAANLNANFLLERWDTMNGKWGARIENGTGQVGSHTVQFGGGAAGTIDSGTSFSGTGSGTAR